MHLSTVHFRCMKKYKVKQSKVSGDGLFATQKIAKDEYIITYTGEYITDTEANKRKSKYIFEIDDTHSIDAQDEKNTARYINHFCEPNVEARIVNGEIRFYANRDIDKGEELGFDYGEEYVDEFITPTGCKCPKCI